MEAELLALVEPLLAGLSTVHEAGVLHGDIKPANVLVRRKGAEPVLIDFGAAKQVVAEHSQSVAAYTEGYAAMEQVGAGRLGPWTDLYGLGALMWRIVAGGNPPWEDPNWAAADWRPPNPLRVELRMQALALGRRDPLPSARELGTEGYSERVLSAIDRCLELKEENRPANCAELQRLMAGEADEQPIETSSVRSDQGEVDESASTPGFATVPSGLEPGQRRTLVGIAAVLLVLVVSGMVWLGGNRGGTGEVPLSAGFRVETEPKEAKIRLLDGAGEYRAGMELALGEYRVEVSAPRFETRIASVEHRESGSSHSIILRPLEQPPLGTTSRQILTAYIAKMDGIQGSEEYVEAARDRLKELQALDSKMEIARNNARIEKQRKEEQIRTSIEGEWNLAEHSENVSMLQNFVEKWKEEPLARNLVAEAREEIAGRALSEWHVVKNRTSLPLVTEFIDKWKSEALAQSQVEEARQVSYRLENEQKAQERSRRVRDAASSSWADINETTSVSRLEDFINQWEDEADASTWVRYARSRRDELNRISRLRERAKSAWNQIRNTSSIAEVDEFIDDWEDTEEASGWVTRARSLRRELRDQMRESSCIVRYVDGYGNYTGNVVPCPGIQRNYESGDCDCTFTWVRADGFVTTLTDQGRWR